MIDILRARISQPILFFPMLAALAVLTVYGIIQAGLTVTDRWDAALARRVAYDQSHQATVLVARYEERLHQTRAALRRRGYDTGPVNAAMGPRTAEALRAFQEREGLPVTGRADAPTMMALGIEP